MSVLQPPPKRQKQYHGIPEPTSPVKEAAPNVVVQFVTDEDGQSLAPPVNLPADLEIDTLESLVNKLAKSDDDPVPFTFHIDLPDSNNTETPNAAPARVTITKTIQEDILQHPSKAFSTEDILVVRCSPQAVFRVRPATRCSSTLSGHESPILCAAFSPTGRLLATGSGDNNVRLWNLDTETPSHTLRGHLGWVLCVEWEGQERKLASGGYDGHVRLWNPVDGNAIGSVLKGHTKWVTSLSWEPVHINPINPRLASSSKDGTVRVWSASNRKCEYTIGGHSASVNVVRWGGGLKGKGILYTASNDRTVRVWDADGGKPLYVLKDHAHWVTTLALNTDFVLRTGPYDHTARRPSTDLEAQEWAQERFDKLLNNTPELLITGSDDHTLFLWSVFGHHGEGKGTKPVARLLGHQRQISHVAFSPDGRWIASAAWDSSVRLWDGKTGKFLATLKGHVGPVYRLAWSADSRQLISASKDSTLKLWNLKTYKIHTDLPGHTDEVYCVDFVADKVVSGGKDKKVKIWKN